MEDTSIRLATKDDVLFYFELRNDPAVIVSSFSEKSIWWENHEIWFSKKIQDPSSKMFVMEVNDIPAGQVRIDILNNIGEIDVAIAPPFRGKGYASYIIRTSCEIVIMETPVRTIYAHIKTDNQKSVHAFEEAGFKLKGLTEFLGNQCTEMIYAGKPKPKSAFSASVMTKALSSEDLDVRLTSNSTFSSHNLNNWILNQFRLKLDAKILELCCGTGSQTEIMSTLCDKGVIWAIDASFDSIKKLDAKNLPNVKTYIGDIDELPESITKESFDIIFCSYGLYYSRDTKKLIQNAYRLLKLDGRLIIIGPYGDNNKELWDLIQRVYPLDPDVLFTCDGYMPKLVEPFCRELFSKVDTTHFENRVSYPTPKNLFDYIAASTVYDANYKSPLMAEITKAFTADSPFKFTKKAMCLIAQKNEA